MLNKIRRYWYQGLQWQDYMLGVWSCRAMQARGFSSRPVHPKHLFDEKRSEYLHEWYRGGMTYLDLGSGVGTDCILARDAGADLGVGLEGNRKSILTAIERAGGNTGTTCFIQFDLEQGKLPFRSDCFDLVNFSNVLEHLNNRETVLKEIKRVKKSEGLVIISIPNSETSWKKKRRAVGLDSMDDPDHKIEYSRESLRSEMAAADLTICSALMPIIPSFPWNGIIAMSAALSPRLYKRLQRKKREYVENNPDESIGWVFAVK